MSAYVIVNINVKDPVRYEDYKRQAAPTVAAFDGRYVVRGGPAEVLEGSWTPKRLVVLEFPTMARAREWINSAEYAPARRLRHATADSDMILVEGM